MDVGGTAPIPLICKVHPVCNHSAKSCIIKARDNPKSRFRTFFNTIEPIAMNLKLKYLLYITAPFMMACSADDDANPSSHGTPIPPVALISNDLSGTSSAMGYHLFRELVADKPGENIIISPWSLQSALLMATEGAEGPARTELEALLRLENTDIEALRNEYLTVHSSLTSSEYHPTVTSSNAFFYDGTRVAVNPSFPELLDENYGAGSENLFFDDPSSRQFINDWVSDRTNSLVPEILEEPIPAEQIFYLINALYFKSDWMEGFNPEITADGTFRRGDGSTVEVPMITSTRIFLHAENDNLQMVDLPFRDSTFSLSLVVPTGEDISDLTRLEYVTPEGMSQLYSEAEPQYVHVRFPQMDLHFKYDLIPNIQNLGYSAPFTAPPSDFSGISEEEGGGMALEPVLHEVILKVDEKGAEGAAVFVTSGISACFSYLPKVAFNRPFVLSLRHIPTGVQLFFGLVDEPMP